MRIKKNPKPQPQPQHNKLQFSQQGNALVFALLIVSVSAVIAYALIQTSSFAVRRTAHLINTDMCDQAMQAAEIYARSLLLQEKKTDLTPVTTLNEIWADPWQMQLMEKVTLNAQLHDEQGKFNVNLLASNAAKDIYAPGLIFTRLLILLNIGEAQALERALNQWISEKGGEIDAVYLEREPAYQAARAPLTSISELHLVQGFSKEIVSQLEPYISALPSEAKLNVNTADARILAALLDAPLETVQSFVHERDVQPFNSVDEFVEKAKARGLPIKDEIKAMIAVNSSYFLLETDVACQKGGMIGYSFVKRSSEGEAYVYRHNSAL